MREIVFIIVLFFANTVQAITGFAGTLLAMPASVLLIGIHDAKVILNIMAFLSCLWIVRKEYRNIEIRVLREILVFMGAGMGIGIWMFQKISLDFLLPMYGVMIIFIACKNLFAGEKQLFGERMKVMILLAAGMIHGMFVSGGALLVVYASAEMKEKQIFRATVASVWVVLNFVLMISDYVQGYMTVNVLKISIISILPLFLAMYLGNRIHEKIRQKVFLKIVYVLLLISGFTIIF